MLNRLVLICKHIKHHSLQQMLCNKGAAMLEFAFVLPFLLIMLLGGIEISRMVLFSQKIENATSNIADMITRIDSDEVTCAQLTSLRDDLLVQMMRPHDFIANGGGIIVSAVEASYPNPDNQDNNKPLKQVVTWQWQSAAEASKIGVPNGLAQGPEWPVVFRQAPNDGGMFNRDRIIAVETFYTYETLVPAVNYFLNIEEVTAVYKRAFYRARFGNMSSFDNKC